MKAFKRIIDGHKLLRSQQPDLIEEVTRDLTHFENVCRNLGIRDYHLNVAYRPFLVILYSIKLLFILLVTLPLFVWGLVNSAIPFYLTRIISHRLAKSADQYDTAKILSGFVMFSLFWGLQVYFVYRYAGLNMATVYFLTVVLSAFVVVTMRHKIFSIRENVHVFILFLRNRGLKEHLISRRSNLERELARLVKIANSL